MMTLDTGTLRRILVEVTLGVAPKTRDKPEMAEKRRIYKQQVDAIAAKGGIIDIPSNFPRHSAAYRPHEPITSNT